MPSMFKNIKDTRYNIKFKTTCLLDIESDGFLMNSMRFRLHSGKKLMKIIILD